MSETILFDAESNGLLDTVTKIHCIAGYVLETGEELFSDKDHTEMIERLNNADRIVAHNAVAFDVPLLQMFFPEFKPKGFVFDTLIMCRSMWPDVRTNDYKRMKKGTLPGRLIGSHSLEAYGLRLNEKKGEYGKQEGAWEVYTPEMKTYCIQDVVVLTKLYERILKVGPSPEMVELEHGFATIIERQIKHGIVFDEEAAIKLMITLRKESEDLRTELQEVFPPMYEPVQLGKVFTSKVNNQKRHVTKGAMFCKIKIKEFNPNSRPQIAERLIKKYNWSPQDVTEKGSISVNETILLSLDYPEAKMLARYMMLAKRLGQLSDGNMAWLKLQKKGRIHGRVNTNGAVSGRCTHSSPNLAQTPSVNSPFGGDCRELFKVPDGYALVGADASGLELRCLAHYLAKFDGGKYGQIILNGDIHTENQKAADLPTRNMAKTFIYGFLYGAGVGKLGSIVGGGPKEGNILKNRFFEKLPALKQLSDAVAEVVSSRGSLNGLDGRKMVTRSPHSALNLLLQGAGALVMKRALIECDIMAKEANLDYEFVLNVHDEWQAEVREDHAEEFAKISEKAMNKAGEYFNFRIPIDGEAKIGKTWKDTH